MKTRRAIINKAPPKVAASLARAFLPTVTSAADVVRVARTWVGVPFRHQGRDHHGLDCWGLPVVTLQELGALPEGFDEPGYPRTPLSGQIEAHLEHYCTKLPEPTPGCLIALTLRQTLAHVGIYTEANTLIQSIDRDIEGGVREHGFRGLWRTRYSTGAWALPGVRYG